MTSSAKTDSRSDTQPRSDGNLVSTCGRRNELHRTVQILETLAHTLGVPVERFFETTQPTPADDASADDIAELTRAFLAIRDPNMRRYCLDVVTAAGAETVRSTAGSAGAPA